LRLPTTEIKADIDFIAKTKKQKVFCYFVDVLCIFILAEISILSRKATNRKLKNCVRRAEKIKSVRTPNESFN